MRETLTYGSVRGAPGNRGPYRDSSSTGCGSGSTWQPKPLEEVFRVRAFSSGVAAGALALVGLLVVRADAPVLWHGMLHRGLPFAVLSAIGGTASLAATAARRYRVARVAAAAAVAAVLGGWGAAQWPLLIVPDLHVRAAAAPHAARDRHWTRGRRRAARFIPHDSLPGVQEDEGTVAFGQYGAVTCFP